MLSQKMALCQKRKESKDFLAYGYDTKFAYHLLRLLGEAEMILIENDLDLERNREQLKSIRRGEWTLEQVKEAFYSKEKQLEEAYVKCTLPNTRHDTEDVLKQLLIDCLEEYYGSLEECILVPNPEKLLLSQVYELLNKTETSLEVEMKDFLKVLAFLYPLYSFVCALLTLAGMSILYFFIQT
jgi:hypothetical protein